MNPIRRFLIKQELLPITPADLTALLDRAGDARLPIRARFQAWLEYTLFTQSPARLDALLDTLMEALTRSNDDAAVPVRPDTDRVVSPYSAAYSRPKTQQLED